MSLLPSALTRRLSLLDAAFLALETRDIPMHVASLQIYSVPADADGGFIKSVVHRYRKPYGVGSPWNQRLARVPLARIAPAFETTVDIDFDYHVRHSALPQPGGERELGELISHLHGTLLDRSRPLWTCHVIEGLSGNRFAIYLKIHHAITDGVRGLRMIERALESQPGSCFRPPWEAAPRPATKVPRTVGAGLEQQLPPLDALRELVHALRPMLHRRAEEADLVRPFESPASSLNGLVTNARRVATQSVATERIKRIGAATGASTNDIFLSLCAGALRRHLLSLGMLPARPMTAAVPVSLRQEGDASSSNAVGFVWSSLATDIADPSLRMQTIVRSMRAAKAHLKSMPSELRLPFTSLLALPGSVLGMLGLAHRLRPAMNVVISNVPGPANTMYLGPARLDALYPISIPSQGQALNITCVNYAGRLDIGFTGSRDALPSLQKLAVYTAEALSELEQALALKRPTADKADAGEIGPATSERRSTRNPAKR
ncbi:WS/DGAT/MGAT family O-acyltransferase [Nevskia sp.]|uniref:WS/DGAT/MGAT family O-acyltransferase n=1 Tax=Nevskia sp. TaxID=1929292 RepID=UPI003F72191C